MSGVLTYYGKKFGARASKLRLLKLMVVLEREVPESESTLISEWLGSERTDKVLRNRLNKLRGIEYNTAEIEEDVEVMQDIQASGKEASGKECTICLETLTMANFPIGKLSTSCQHEPTICRLCIARSLNVQIEEVSWDQVACPECPETLSFDAVREHASDTAFEKYDRKSLMSAFKDVPNFTMCLGPGCGSGQIHSGGDDQPIMTCSSCRFKTCYIHKMPWHTDQTCAEYDIERQERMEQEAKTLEIIAKKTRPCANKACQTPIEKNGGCEHMTCTKCKHQFCWLCAASWRTIQREGNTAHAESCRFHSKNLPQYRGPTIFGDVIHQAFRAHPRYMVPQVPRTPGRQPVIHHNMP